MENLKTIELDIKGINFKKITAIDKNGTNENVTFTKNADRILIKHPIEYLSTATLILN